MIVSILFSFCSVTASAIAGTPTEIAPVTETTPQIVQDNPLITPTIIDTDISDSEIILPGTTETYEEYVPFVSISANEYAQSYEGLTDLSYAFTIYSHQEYDYIAVSYATTMNITLDDYADDVIYYTDSDENATLSLDFSAMSIADINLDAHSIDFEKIVFDYEVYYKNELVQSDSTTVSVLPTDHGTYASAYGGIESYNLYIGNLLSAELISSAEYNDAHRRMTAGKKISNSYPLTDEEYRAYRDSLVPAVYDMKYYDPVGKDVEISSNSDWRNAKKLLVQEAMSTMTISPRLEMTLDTANTVAMTSTRSDDYFDVDTQTDVIFTYIMYSFTNGERVTVEGRVQWTDLDGNIHPARNLTVRIMAKKNTGDICLTTAVTGNDGYFLVAFDNDLSAAENGYDVYMRAIFNTENRFEVKSNSGVYSQGYYVASDVIEDVKGTATDDEVGSSSLLSEANLDNYNKTAADAISIHQALTVGYYYYNEMENGLLDTNDKAVALYPENDTEASSASNIIYLESKKYYCWDAILHELGHLVAYDLSISTQFYEGDLAQDSHRINENLAESQGKNNGIKQAWNEGWATYFSLASQEYYEESSGCTISNIPGVADMKLSVWEQEPWGSYTIKLITHPYIKDSCYGEANEFAITHVLLCMLKNVSSVSSYYANQNNNQDNEEQVYNDQALWNIFKQSQAKTCIAFVKYLHNNYCLNGEYVNIPVLSGIGKILENSNIAATPSNEDNTILYSRNSAPVFSGLSIRTQDSFPLDNSEEYEYVPQACIVLIDSDCRIKHLSTDIDIDLSANLPFEGTIPLSYWKAFCDELTGNDFYWGIGTFEDQSPPTGIYLSSLRHGFIRERIPEISLSNPSKEITLSDGDFSLVRFQATTAGTYTFYTTGDADTYMYLLNSPVSSIYEGMEYVEVSDDDAKDLNSMLTVNLLAGQCVYLALREYDYDECEFTLCVAKIEVSTLNSQISAELEEGGYSLHKFTASASDDYAFFTLSNIDTYIEVFEYPVSDIESTENRIGYNDDSPLSLGDDFDAFLNVTLEEGQTVYIRVRGYSEYDFGSYSFCVTEAITSAQLNVSYNRSIETNNVEWFEFVAEEDGTYLFYTGLDIGVDTYGELYNGFKPINSNALLLASNDDAFNSEDDQSNYNFGIEYDLLAGDIVYIKITGYENFYWEMNYNFQIEKVG